MSNSLKYVVFSTKTFVVDLRDIRQVFCINIIYMILAERRELRGSQSNGITFLTTEIVSHGGKENC